MPAVYERLMDDITSFLDMPFYEAFSLSAEQRDAIHLANLQQRFATLRGRVKALDRVATEQGVDEIRTLDDAVPLFFPHTVYKSYPLAFLERNRFDALTRWLDGLTAIDLSGVDASGIDSIDDWLRMLEETTPLKINHTFGTTGKLSFVPRTKAQWRQGIVLSGNSLRDWNGPGTGPDVLHHHMPLVAPTYRHGFSTTARALDGMVEHYAGGDGNAIFLYPDGYVSADVASLAGRLNAAAARGEQGRLELSPTLLARREQFAALDRNRPQAMKDFLARVQDRFGGQDVFLFGFWPVLHDWAEEGLSQGIKGLFGPRSVLNTGGGTKGRVFADGWRERIFDFLGFDNVYDTFGMSEIVAGNAKCDAGNYHFPPVTVPYVLDVDTGAPMPRTGRQTGRLAVMDLMPDNYWGGLVTGDLVTIGGWDEPCACGRHAPYLDPDIRRIADVKGGEDKINCAGAPEAHDRAVEYLVSQSA
jgi:hypothetical protein